MPRIWRWSRQLHREWNELRPVLSIFMIISTLLGLVFLQMEERRLGYSILKMSHTYKTKVDERRALEIRLAQATRLEKLESLASQRLTLKRAQSYQVIYLNDAGLIEEGPDLRFDAAAAREVTTKDASASARKGFQISSLMPRRWANALDIGSATTGERR